MVRPSMVNRDVHTHGFEAFEGAFASDVAALERRTLVDAEVIHLLGIGLLVTT